MNKGDHICDIGALHVEGIVFVAGDQVSEVRWLDGRHRALVGEYQNIGNEKLLIWGSDAHQAAIAHSSEVAAIDGEICHSNPVVLEMEQGTPTAGLPPQTNMHDPSLHPNLLEFFKHDPEGN